MRRPLSHKHKPHISETFVSVYVVFIAGQKLGPQVSQIISILTSGFGWAPRRCGELKTNCLDNVATMGITDSGCRPMDTWTPFQNKVKPHCVSRRRVALISRLTPGYTQLVVWFIRVIQIFKHLFNKGNLLSIFMFRLIWLQQSTEFLYPAG